MKTTLALVALALWTVGCGGGGGNGTGGGAGGGGGSTGSVSGTVSIFRGAGESARADPTLSAFVRTHKLLERPKLEATARLPGAGQVSAIRPGEVIVRFEEVLSAQDVLKRVRLDEYAAQHSGHASEFLHLVTFTQRDGKPLTEAQTLALTDRLSSLAGVRFAEVNRTRHAQAVPDDPLYAAQWHYPAMNLPAAWDVTTGSAQVVVAVIDTGIVNHPELNSRVVPGYDFISDPAISLDGDGRDANPNDEGKDFPQEQSSWHGTHVAGTIGAVSNNRTGLAGVDWNARLLPVRVLGKGGGTDFDIAAGVQWAAGGTVPGTPSNANPAAVLNLSLGGEGSPSQTYQDVIDAAVGRGAVVVVASGNANMDSTRFSPCNQQQVICVGATRFSGKRASYANYGNAVHLVAPGGELLEDANGDNFPDGVLSTFNKDNTPNFDFLQGTSMACPHVAGVVALMKARAPTLTAAQAKMALTSTANTAFQCSEGCGAGMVNAHAAVLAAVGQSPGGPAKLVISTTELFLSSSAREQALTITNVGGQATNVTLTAGGAEGGRLSFPRGAQGTVNGGQSASFPVAADFNGLADGTYAASITVSSPVGGGSVTVKLRAGTPANQAPAVVALVYQDQQGAWQVGGAVEATAANSYRYTIDAPPGRYFVLGLVDSNNNGDFDDGEPYGLWPTRDSPQEVEVVAGQVISSVDFGLAPDSKVPGGGASEVGLACADNAPCGTGGECLTGWPQGYCSKECSTSACPLGAKCIDFGSVQACLATCTGPRAGQSTCRSAYVCEDDGTGAGVCVPACTSNTDCDPLTCNTSTGYCG
ncbi:MAG: S8 family serine peptidase [Myxococcota bacterium]